MNYPESAKIKNYIESAKQILVNCHASPDADSVGSALAMHAVLSSWGKEVEIVCPHEIPDNLRFLQKSEEVKIVDFSKLDFEKYDLFITLDSGSWNRVTGRVDLEMPKIPIIVIDHHETNTKYGQINLIKPNMAANCELLYYVFQDFGINLRNSEEHLSFNHDIGEALLTGILGDTGSLRFPEADSHTLEVVLALVNFVNKEKVILNLYQSYSLPHVKVWAAIMNKMKIDIDGNFVWAALGYDEFHNLGYVRGAKSEIADMLFQSIEGTDFGFVAIEEDKGFLSVSFRSRTGVDVSKIAMQLGGGGHKWAAAARVYDMKYDDAIDLVIDTVRKFAR